MIEQIFKISAEELIDYIYEYLVNTPDTITQIKQFYLANVDTLSKQVPARIIASYFQQHKTELDALLKQINPNYDMKAYQLVIASLAMSPNPANTFFKKYLNIANIDWIKDNYSRLKAYYRDPNSDKKGDIVPKEQASIYPSKFCDKAFVVFKKDNEWQLGYSNDDHLNIKGFDANNIDDDNNFILGNELIPGIMFIYFTGEFDKTKAAQMVQSKTDVQKVYYQQFYTPSEPMERLAKRLKF